MRVSVIIPVYNSEKHISRAIDSVLRQTLPACEVIVINDGSKDGTEKVLEQFNGRIIYKTVPNGGASKARNIGIAMSTGEWVAFLDSDDEWQSDKLERQVALIARHPQAGLVFSAYDLTSGQKEQARTISFGQIHPLGQTVVQRNQPVIEDCFYLLFIENFIKTSTVMIRRDILNQAGFFDETLRTVEDRDLFIRVANLTAVLFVREPLVRKWHLADSLGQENLGVINDRERVQSLNLERYSAKIAQAGQSGLIDTAIGTTKRSRLTLFRHSRDIVGMVLAMIDFFLFKMFRFNTKLFVK
jgi:glycosyltransferase involved in cell wall biosynthesis